VERLTTDPSDKALDAQAADNFGGKDTSHRAGYGTVTFDGQTYSKMEWILRAAKLGHTLAAGESTKLVAYYEQQMEALHTALSDQIKIANTLQDDLDELLRRATNIYQDRERLIRHCANLERQLETR
jgi:hypothetical protein